MADEPPPMDYGERDEDGEVEQSRPEASEEKGTEEPPASLEPDEEDEPPSLEPESEPTQPDPLSPPPAGQAVSAPPPTLEARAADDGDEVPVTKPVVQQLQRTLDLFDDEPPAYPQHVSSQEDTEQYELEITVSHPEKVGDGMGAYIVYSITTKTTVPAFKSPHTTVRRRFSDFLRLHNKMTETHLPKGRIVPPAPEKSVKGMTTVKFSKSEESNALFLERRQASLQRYLNRIAKHPVLRRDADFMEFLENPNELPKATETTALSGAGFMRLVKNVGQSISKITSKKSETDSWFDEQQQNYEALDTHLKKLHHAVEGMIVSRKELCVTTGNFVKSVATLGNVEENNTVSRALSRLSEVQEKVESLHSEQTKHDLFTFGETIKDYIALLGAIRAAFGMRVRAYTTWQSSQQSLSKKREQEQKLTAAGKMEKLQVVKAEILEWEGKVEESQKLFEDASRTLKAEVTRFEVNT
jgi:sorting nexin-1/2